MSPTWYSSLRDIIDFKIYIEILKPIYDTLEGKHVSKSELDPFAKMIMMAGRGLTEEQWLDELRTVQIWKTLTMGCGNLHQKIMGACPGWQDLKQGHATKCDLMMEDGSAVAEIKNNVNTMNSDSKASVEKKLHAQISLGKQAFLVIVNGNIPTREVNNITWISGKEFYELITGRSSMFDDLQDILVHTFTVYNTYEELKKCLT